MPESSTSRIASCVNTSRPPRWAAAPLRQSLRQEQINLPQIQMPIDFPLRVQNGRTHRAQAAYIERHELLADFFDDPESNETQEARETSCER